MMRQLSITIFFLLAVAVASKAQQVIYSQTFEDTASLFQDYALSNLDKGIPAETALDTLKTVPWFVTTVGTASNHAAIATSNYNPAKAADDWFVTPAIRIGKASKLTWKSRQLTAGKTDSYQVFVSTTEKSVSGCLFNGRPASYTSDNSTAFSTNTFDLAAAGYANQTVYIGFRLNTATGGDKLAIDDLLVTEDSTHFVSLTFQVNMSKYIADTLFNPRTDTVDIAFPYTIRNGKNYILSIVPGSDSAIYSTTIPGFLDGDELEFKFRINSSWNDTAAEFPYGQPNRMWTVEHNLYTYTCYYNKLGATFGIIENPLMEQVKVYPNPAESYVLVGVPDDIKKLIMVNLTGSKVLEREIHTGHVINLDISSLTKGTYVLLFYTDKGFTGSKKLIKN